MRKQLFFHTTCGAGAATIQGWHLFEGSIHLLKGGRAFSSPILFLGLSGTSRYFFSKRFRCLKGTSKKHPECCIQCTSTCVRFRVWLQFMSG